jgi:hypothetical protein
VRDLDHGDVAIVVRSVDEQPSGNESRENVLGAAWIRRARNEIRACDGSPRRSLDELQ